MATIPYEFTGKSLLSNRKLHRLELCKELKKLNLLTESQIKTIKNEIIVWDDEKRIVVFQKKFKELRRKSSYWDNVRTVGKHKTAINVLTETRKIVYNRQYYTATIYGAGYGYFEDTEIKFFTNISKDADNFLSVNSLWLAVPEFQKLLKQNIKLKNLVSSLDFDRKSKYFIPTDKKFWFFKKVRNSIGSSEASLTWDASSKRWTPKLDIA